MTRSLLSLGGALLGASLAAAQSSTLSSTGSAPVSMMTSAPQGRNGTNSTGDACGVVASIASSVVKESPSAVVFKLPVESAQACLQAIPIDNDLAVKQIDYISKYIQFQSTLAYLKNPPEGYLNPPVDIMGGLAEISEKASNGGYRGQHDFELDIYKLIGRAYDGHFSFNPLSIGGLFQFGRQINFVSISEDGHALPKVYAFPDLNQTASSGSNLTWTPSAVTHIDGQDVAEYLQTLADLSNPQDPDARYNQMFYELAESGVGQFDLFSNPTYNPGPGVTVKFENGTTRSIENLAQGQVLPPGIDSGEAIFSAFFLPTTTSALASGSPSATLTALPQTQTPSPVPTGYPTPVVKNTLNYANGYYLTSEENSQVAVLSLPSFLETESNELLREWQNDIDQFLIKAKADGKTKLIIDLQGNPGGTTALAYDAFKQLFPTITPYVTSRYRYSEALDLMVTTASDYAPVYNESLASTYYLFLNANGLLDANNKNFSSTEAFLGPHEFNGDNFTSLERTAIMEPGYAVANDFQVTGYGNRSNVTTQPFAAKDMVLLYDGFCGSSCSIFSDLMRTQGEVRSIAVGGRPMYGPMQGVGAVKGNLVEPFANLNSDASLVASLLPEEEQEKYNSTLPIGEFPINVNSRAGASNNVNFADNIRKGDESQTPLQFIYQAADCRLFFTADNLFDITTLWDRVAQTAWGNGTCVAGSTGDKSALPGAGFSSPKANSTTTTNGTNITNGASSTPTPSMPPPSSGAAILSASTSLGAALAVVGLVFLAL
ncbi:MAG: hypothetical protein M4579_007141 [Chaenotheca gracillima]|nr:MAG: hypothetical protein M4579_007141 [Chaenotheca gracillima]